MRDAITKGGIALRLLANRWVSALSAITVLMAALVWGALQPWTANHFGYALPGKQGLPSYVYAQGRRYHAVQSCANVSTSPCEPGALQCWTTAQLRSRGEWPLRPAGAILTLFGAPRPLLRNAAAINAPYLVANGGDCYVEYALEGGP